MGNEEINNYLENSKNDYIIIILGVIIIIISSLSKNILGKLNSRIINFIGVLILSYSLLLSISHISTFCKKNPYFLLDEKLSLFKKNIFACSLICLLILSLIIYSIYNVFF